LSSLPNPAYYNDLVLEWNVGEIIYYIYSPADVPLKIIWCLHIFVAGTTNTLTAYCLPLLWRL